MTYALAPIPSHVYQIRLPFGARAAAPWFVDVFQKPAPPGRLHPIHPRERHAALFEKGPRRAALRRATEADI